MRPYGEGNCKSVHGKVEPEKFLHDSPVFKQIQVRSAKSRQN